VGIGVTILPTRHTHCRRDAHPTLTHPSSVEQAGDRFFGGGAALRIGLSYALHKKHPKIADGILIEGTGENTFSAVYTAHYAK